MTGRRASDAELFIPEHELIRPIAAGAYGEVWLARNAIGTLRAIKIVCRDQHASVETFEREFRGLQKFEPISRTHENLVDILTLGLLPENAGFYYVMELADSAPITQSQATNTRQALISESENCYIPRTLRAELKARGALPADEVIALGLKLTAALAHLHGHGLVHRDVKPSNILFIDGEPKLADAGLVAPTDDARSLVGTAGYIAPEGPGTAKADIYALGKVLYEAVVGKDRLDFPALSSEVARRQDHKAVLELNEVLLKACEANPGQRYQTAEQLSDDLRLLQGGGSVKRHMQLRRQRKIAAWTMSIVAGFAFLSGMIYRFSSSLPDHFHPSEAAQRAMERRGTKSWDAYNLYLVGRAHWNKRTPEGLSNAIASFEAALRIDPNFARAHSGMADAYSNLAVVSAPAREFLTRQRGAVLKALALDDSMADAHANLAALKEALEWDWPGAEREYKRSLELDPNYATGHQWYAEFLAAMNRPEEAIREARLSVRLDPTSYVINAWAGNTLFFCGRHQEAIEQLRKAAELNEHAADVPYFLGEVYFHLGRHNEAIEAWMHSEELAKRASETLDQDRKEFEQGGWRAYCRRYVEREKAAAEERKTSAYWVALDYVHLGELDEAAVWLERAVEEQFPLVSLIQTNPAFDPLRNHPKYRAAVRLMKLPE